jgi:predicted DNA-binding protein
MTEEVVQLSIPNFPVSLKQKLEALAEQDQRKLAAYLRVVLARHVQAIEAFDLAEKTPQTQIA